MCCCVCCHPGFERKESIGACFQNVFQHNGQFVQVLQLFSWTWRHHVAGPTGVCSPLPLALPRLVLDETSVLNFRLLGCSYRLFEVTRDCVLGSGGIDQHRHSSLTQGQGCSHVRSCLNQKVSATRSENALHISTYLLVLFQILNMRCWIWSFLGTGYERQSIFMSLHLATFMLSRASPRCMGQCCTL